MIRLAPVWNETKIMFTSMARRPGIRNIPDSCDYHNRCEPSLNVQRLTSFHFISLNYDTNLEVRNFVVAFFDWLEDIKNKRRMWNLNLKFGRKARVAKEKRRDLESLGEKSFNRSARIPTYLTPHIITKLNIPPTGQFLYKVRMVLNHRVENILNWR